MFGELTIRTERDITPVLLIPREALIRTGEQNRVVLSLDGGRFKSVSVTPGRIGRDQVEILNGIEAGDRIVTSAQFLIDSESSKTSDFLRMTPTGEETPAAGEMDHSVHEGMDHTRSPEAVDHSAHQGMDR